MYRAPPLAKGSKKEVPALSLKPLANSLMAERAGFEPARELLTPYSISNRAPSAILSHLSTSIQLSILCKLAERVRFELTRRGLAAYSISSRAPSTNSAISPQTREK